MLESIPELSSYNSSSKPASNMLSNFRNGWWEFGNPCNDPKWLEFKSNFKLVG
jgi:hypothetical protein